MSRKVSAIVLVVVLAVASAACGGDDGGGADTGTTGDPAADHDTVIALDVVGEELVGGSRQEDVSLGDRVLVTLTGDTADQVHVHGYDLYIDPVDGAGEVEFDALIPGTFEIELEGSGRLLVRMTVS